MTNEITTLEPRSTLRIGIEWLERECPISFAFENSEGLHDGWVLRGAQPMPPAPSVTTTTGCASGSPGHSHA